MSKTVIIVENLSKQYRLGLVGTGTLSQDLNRWWHLVRGKEDPYLKIGETNDRASRGNSEYVWALRDINFEVKEGEVLGIIGKNGAGKSTLLKLLSKVTAPTTGSIKAKGRIASLLEVGTGFHPELTGRENIYLNGTILGMTKAEVASKLDEIVAFAGVERYLDTPVKRYSSGMKVRLGFAVAAHLEPEILIVDEVLAVGDAEFQRKAVGKMQEVSQERGRTVLFVSHNMNSIQNLCSSLMVLKDGYVTYIGNTNEGIEHYLSTSLSSKKLNIKGNQFNKFKLEKISCFLEEKLEVDSFLSGQNISFQIEYSKKDKEINEVGVRLEVKSTFGELLFTAHSYHSHGKLKIANNKGLIKCFIDRFPLVAGNYQLDLQIRDLTHKPHYTVFESENVFQFRVENGDYYGTGIIPKQKKLGKIFYPNSWIVK